MLDRVVNRPARRSAGAALLASVVVHVGLLGLGIWLAPEHKSDKVAALSSCELVVLVGDDEPGKRASAGKDVTLSIAEPTAAAGMQSRVLDMPPLPVSDQGTEPGPSVHGTFPNGPTIKHDGGDSTGSEGIGPSFFQLTATGRTVVYVLDRSMSMGVHDGLRQARTELLTSLGRLTPTALFQIIAYNQIAEPLSVHNHAGMLSPDHETLAEVTRALTALHPVGRTNHVQALQRGLTFRPDVLFFATDADELTTEEVAAVSRYNGGRCSIHVIDFSNRPVDAASPLRLLAVQNRGTYRRVAVKAL